MIHQEATRQLAPGEKKPSAVDSTRHTRAAQALPESWGSGRPGCDLEGPHGLIDGTHENLQRSMETSHAVARRRSCVHAVFAGFTPTLSNLRDFAIFLKSVRAWQGRGRSWRPDQVKSLGRRRKESFLREEAGALPGKSSCCLNDWKVPL